MFEWAGLAKGVRQFEMDDLSGYLRAKEPGMREKAYAWRTAIGLQKVDGLMPSDYLLATAKENIEGEITLAESRRRIEGYYKARPVTGEAVDRVREADLVSQHIVEILAEPTFSLTPASYAAIHRKLFRGVFSHAGKIRDYNITKSEWVLAGDTVRYESADVVAANAWYFRNALVRANYVNLPQGVHPTPVYLERFFANLVLGERNELKSRFLHVSLPAPPRTLVPFSGEQAGEQARQTVVEALKGRPSKQVARLLSVLKGEMTVLEIMAALKLGGRRNFLERYLTPAIDAGWVERTNQDAPRSPTQRYRLTASGERQTSMERA